MKKNNVSEQKQGTEKIFNRISRIEGQLKGIRRMIEEKKGCLDIMNQLLAVREAVSMLGVEMLKEDMVCNLKDRKSIDEAYLKALFRMK